MSDAKSTLTTLLVQGLLPLAVTVVFGLLGKALLALDAWLRERAKTSQLARAASLLDVHALAVVNDVEATVRVELGKATADGRLTQDEIHTIQVAALQKLKLSLGEHGLAAVRDALGVAAPYLDGFLRGVLEKAVGTLPPTTQDEDMPAVVVAPVP